MENKKNGVEVKLVTMTPKMAEQLLTHCWNYYCKNKEMKRLEIPAPMPKIL